MLSQLQEALSEYAAIGERIAELRATMFPRGTTISWRGLTNSQQTGEVMGYDGRTGGVLVRHPRRSICRVVALQLLVEGQARVTEQPVEQVAT